MGVELVLFPCGQFGGQEMATDAEIKDFINEQGLMGMPNVHVMAKGDVKGANMHPAWKIMQEATGAADPSWNFAGKFIIGKDGAIQSVPKGSDVVALIEEALAK